VAKVTDNQSNYHEAQDGRHSTLIRGGFRVGLVPGLPRTYRSNRAVAGVLRVKWKKQHKQRFPLTNLARTALAEDLRAGRAVVKIWLRWLLVHIHELPPGLLEDLSMPIRGLDRSSAVWLEEFTAYQIHQLAANGWYAWLRRRGLDAAIRSWENSSGDSLPQYIFRDGCSVILQDLVMTKVCKLQMGRAGETIFNAASCRLAENPSRMAVVYTRTDSVGVLRRIHWEHLRTFVLRICGQHLPQRKIRKSRKRYFCRSGIGGAGRRPNSTRRQQTTAPDRGF
jgi:hypothetical protein